ncbi:MULTISPECIES: hypothetical protein [unclassified Chryseobacterium]|uniref:hypothetical protein n=1 Tax=unclassified Chryseobacterium TaxID=2593645 RepID=UPI000D3B2915|nr:MULTISPECIES: hypothetical protein [unclassified Chryseobacterium]PTT77237.1 hypothetical protein DBR25_03690 [Chryseobacterium sp. HMWF001]PVV57255.1 hypothetical protein DD829_08815 [Chryseobacterium sp. HMWF035]
MKKSYFIMLMALAFLLQGCRTENMNDESASTGAINKFQLSSKRISLAESKHKLQLIPEISKATTFLKSKVSGKTINNISIDTDHVTYIENGPNYHTYTFNIIKENTEENAPVENLVLTPLPDGTYKGLIFRYNFTKQEKQNILNGIPVDTKGKTTIYEAEGSFNASKVTECNYVEETIWQDCSEHIHNQSNFGDWINCTAEIKPQVYTIGYWSCSSGGGGNESGSGNTGSEDGTGGGNAGNDNCITEVFQNPLDPVAVYNPCPIGVPTAPTLSGSFSLYVNSLPANLKNLLNNYANSDFYDGLSSYFYANNGSSEAKAFISWAAQFKLDNPTTTWEQFQSWFIDDVIDIGLQSEMLEDWADPTRVKPTIKFKKHIKINSIYNKIKTAANFKQYLQNFEPTFSVAHLMFDIGAVENPAALAQTKTPVNYWIKITFNKDWDFANTPKILIAGSFMHEIIHAEMYRKLLSLSSSNGNIDQALLGTMLNQHNYPGLFDYYIKNVKGNDSAQHQMMGAHYINIIKNALKQVYGNQYTDVEYLSIAWQGLKNTTAWSLLPQAERDLYEQTYQNNYNLWEK